MSQQIQCPHCGQTYALTDEQAPQYAGQTITCTKCQKPFTVPSTPSVTAPVPPQVSIPTGAPPFVQPGGAPLNYGLQGNYGQQQTTSGLAIASLVLSIIGILFFPAGLVGIVLGIVALTRMRDPRVGGKGLAIGGIAVGVVSILMAGCMLSILLPSLGRARQVANRVKCAANLRQIGQALLLYSNDNRGAYPPNLGLLLTTQNITPGVFVCPDGNDTPAPGSTPQQQAAALNSPGHLSYVYVGANLTNMASANTVVMYEPFTNHNNDGCNILWGDGHVSWESKVRAQQLINGINNGKNGSPVSPGGGL